MALGAATGPSSSSSPSKTSPASLHVDERVRKRYFDELRNAGCLQLSDEEDDIDESYPQVCGSPLDFPFVFAPFHRNLSAFLQGPAPGLSKKQRRHLSAVQASLGVEFRPIRSTFDLRRPHPADSAPNTLGQVSSAFRPEVFFTFLLLFLLDSTGQSGRAAGRLAGARQGLVQSVRHHRGGVPLK